MSNITPLFKKVAKGTFITFPSSLIEDDLNFSYFVLVKIPPMTNQGSNFRNTVNFNSIEGHFTEGLSNATQPENDIINFTESLQNYLFNMETLLVNSNSFNPKKTRSVSERIFFKWLKELGALRFKNSDPASYINFSDILAPKKFLEENENDSSLDSYYYNRVIQYIGEINLQGKSSINNRNRNKEIYAYVPTQSGNTPKILFETISDDNYYPGLTVKKPTSLNIEYISGRGPDDNPTPVGLSSLAIYDNDVPIGSYTYDVNGGSDPIWFGYIQSNGPDCYFTDEFFDIPNNDLIERTDSTPITITYLRNKLDGISIDFNKNNYSEIVRNPNLKSFTDYNNTVGSQTFDFNAVLLYNSVEDKENPGNFINNLYGVCFLNDIEPISSGSNQFKTIRKIRQNNLTNQQGNGFGFRFSFKKDASSANVALEVDVSVNDYNTYSMVLFSELMEKLNLLNSRYETSIENSLKIQTKYNDLIDVIKNSTDINQLRIDLDNLVSEFGQFTNDPSINQILNKILNEINLIKTGGSTVPISWLLDIKPIDGITLRKNGNNLFVGNSRQHYSSVNIVNLYTGLNNSSIKENILKSNSYNDLFVHENSGITKDLADDLIIYLDDSVKPWKNNQSFKLHFKDPINFNGYGILIYTDSKNKFNLKGMYSVLVGAISVSSPLNSIEVICINETKYKFTIIKN